MYSKEYRETVKNASIDLEVNEKFIKTHEETIKVKSLYPDKISFHFAIMELETWLIAISNIFERLHNDLNNEVVKENLGIDLISINPENEIFHPAILIDKILQIVGDSYDKKKGEINKFLALIDKKDFLELLESQKCESFNRYCESMSIKVEK